MSTKTIYTVNTKELKTARGHVMSPPLTLSVPTFPRQANHHIFWNLIVHSLGVSTCLTSRQRRLTSIRIFCRILHPCQTFLNRYSHVFRRFSPNTAHVPIRKKLEQIFEILNIPATFYLNFKSGIHLLSSSSRAPTGLDSYYHIMLGIEQLEATSVCGIMFTYVSASHVGSAPKL